VEIIASTELAFLMEINGDIHWIPKSQLLEGGNFDAESEMGDQGELIIPEWLAIEKGLV
jgi:hypothetical protein